MQRFEPRDEDHMRGLPVLPHPPANRGKGHSCGGGDKDIEGFRSRGRCFETGGGRGYSRGGGASGASGKGGAGEKAGPGTDAEGGSAKGKQIEAGGGTPGISRARRALRTACHRQCHQNGCAAWACAWGSCAGTCAYACGSRYRWRRISTDHGARKETTSSCYRRCCRRWCYLEACTAWAGTGRAAKTARPTSSACRCDGPTTGSDCRR